MISTSARSKVCEPEVSQLCARRENLVYLSEQLQACHASETTGLVGHDGWADARLGDYERSVVMMNDYRLIEELAHLDKQDRRSRLNDLGDEAARHIRSTLPAALEQYDDVYLVTHVPPWREACWYDGSTSNDEWAPHFTCQAMGEAIEECLSHCPEKRLTVLCGHTHGEGLAKPLDNITVFTGGAKYQEPGITRIFDLNQ